MIQTTDLQCLIQLSLPWLLWQPTRASLHLERIDSLCHQYQFLPLGQAVRGRIIVIQPHVWQADAALLQLQVVYHQTAILRMQNLHTCQGPVHEDERLAVLHVAFHLVGHDTAQ